MKKSIFASALVLMTMSGFANATYYSGGFGNGGVAHTPSSLESMYARQAYNREVNMKHTLNVLHMPAYYANGLPVVPSKPALPGTYAYILQAKNTNAVKQRAEQEALQQRLKAIQQSGAKITGIAIRK